jgi:5-exo-hydroxycamphor dehydrogenase
VISEHAVYVQPGELELWQSDVPSPEPGGVLVRVTHAGVCGTDHHILRGEIPFEFPITMGHEGVGVVEALGEGVETDRAGDALAIGDRVYFFPVAPCHRCFYCTVANDYSLCESPGWPTPADRPGAASYSQLAWLAADRYFFRIPDDTPSEAVIAFGCALPAALQGLERLGPIGTDDNVVVQGCGPVGIAATMLAHLAGARRIVVIGAPEHRLSFAERFGATSTIPLEQESAELRIARVRQLCDGRGADVLIEAAGRLAAFAEGLELLAPNGRYLILGLWAGAGTVPVDPHVLYNNNLRIVGSQFQQPYHYFQTIRLAQRLRNELPFEQAVTHRFPLAESKAAIEAAACGDAVKAVVLPNAL